MTPKASNAQLWREGFGENLHYELTVDFGTAKQREHLLFSEAYVRRQYGLETYFVWTSEGYILRATYSKLSDATDETLAAAMRGVRLVFGDESLKLRFSRIKEENYEF